MSSNQLQIFLLKILRLDMLDIGKRTLFFYFYGKANIFASGKLSSLSRCFRKVFMALPLLQKSFRGFPFVHMRKVSMAFPWLRKAFMVFSFVSGKLCYSTRATQPHSSTWRIYTGLVDKPLKSDKF